VDPKRNFTDDDKAKVVKFLNLVAKHAKFEVDTSELIDYFKSLSYMQQVLLHKIDTNILEVKRVIESQEAEAETESSPESEGEAK